MYPTVSDNGNLYKLLRGVVMEPDLSHAARTNLSQQQGDPQLSLGNCSTMAAGATSLHKQATCQPHKDHQGGSLDNQLGFLKKYWVTCGTASAGDLQLKRKLHAYPGTVAVPMLHIMTHTL
jgi:hypothetical protein